MQVVQVVQVVRRMERTRSSAQPRSFSTPTCDLLFGREPLGATVVTDAVVAIAYNTPIRLRAGICVRVLSVGTDASVAVPASKDRD